MSYKTILVNIDTGTRSNLRVRLAAELAKLEDAHLVGCAVTGISRFIYQDGGINASAPNLMAHLDLLKEQTERARSLFLRAIGPLAPSKYSSVVVNDDAGGGIGLQARYSDLIVIGQTNNDEPNPTVMPDFPEYLLMNAGRPVLIVPYAGEFPSLGKRPLIAWDASREATRAVTDALPILERAELVQVAIFNADATPDAHGDEPGADIALYLARHGVKVNVVTHKTTTDIGNALLSLSHDLNNDLIVMGAYGHSRFREMILGGVTQTILKCMTVPVFMSH